MRTAARLALALLITFATGCSSSNATVDATETAPTETAPTEYTGVPFPAAQSGTRNDPIALDAASGAPEITRLDKDPVVLFDDGTQRVELTQAFLIDDRELWDLSWENGDDGGTAETGVHEPIARCAADWLEPKIGQAAAELVARSVNPYPESPFAPVLLVDALLACDGRSELLALAPTDGLDIACLEQSSDDDLRAIAEADIEAALDAIAPCARPFEELPTFISDEGAACMRNSSEQAFRAGFGENPRADVLAIIERCLTETEMEQLLDS